MTSTEGQPEGERPRRLQPFASFGYRSYRWLWAANVCIALVDASLRFSFVWLFIETLDRGPTFIGLSLALFSLPGLLVTLPAGVWADRKDRRLLLITSHVAVALALLLTVVLGLTESELVLLPTFLAGIGLAIGAPVRAALVPALVPANRLMNGNAVNALGLALGAVAGPAVAGVAINQWGVEGSFVGPGRAVPRPPARSSPRGLALHAGK